MIFKVLVTNSNIQKYYPTQILVSLQEISLNLMVDMQFKQKVPLLTMKFSAIPSSIIQMVIHLKHMMMVLTSGTLLTIMKVIIGIIGFPDLTIQMVVHLQWTFILQKKDHFFEGLLFFSYISYLNYQQLIQVELAMLSIFVVVFQFLVVAFIPNFLSKKLLVSLVLPEPFGKKRQISLFTI